MFFSRALSVASAAYSVVVLPLPVGPQVRISPCGLRSSALNRSSTVGSNPSLLRSSRACDLSRMRMTTFSPSMPGMEEKRRSTVLPSSCTWMRPSWGRRRSAMSSLAMTLRRETTAWCISIFGAISS